MDLSKIRMSESGSGKDAIPQNYNVERRDATALKTADGRKKKKDDAATGVSAAGARALAARAAAFYLLVLAITVKLGVLNTILMPVSRVPVKAFFRTRVEYVACFQQYFETHDRAVTWPLPEQSTRA